jgi:catechol 2,3-dioxygenase-like lactoylglutathione lyase family enzyme
MSATGIHHTSLVVSDLNQSRLFYENILGLKISPLRPDKPFPGVWYDVGGQQIHLLLCPEAQQPSIDAVYPGMQRHVALQVADVDEMKARLDAAAIPYVASRSGRPVVFCKDSDGNCFELIGG